MPKPSKKILGGSALMTSSKVPAAASRGRPLPYCGGGAASNPSASFVSFFNKASSP